MKSEKNNKITFIDTPEVPLRRIKTNSISAYLEKNASLLQKKESAREAEYAATRHFVSQMVIKSDSVGLEKNKNAIDLFANKFVENEDHINKVGYDLSTAAFEISRICGDYISCVEHPEVPVSNLYKDAKGNTVSIKPFNYIAQFSFRSFCQSLGKAIALKIAIGRYEGTEEDILELIVMVAQTLISLAQHIKYEFSPDLSFLLKIIVAETCAGRCSASEEQIIKACSLKSFNKSDLEISQLLDTLADYKIISIIEGKIFIKEKIYY